jgi:hypothetical protein
VVLPAQPVDKLRKHPPAAVAPLVGHARSPTAGPLHGITLDGVKQIYVRVGPGRRTLPGL